MQLRMGGILLVEQQFEESVFSIGDILFHELGYYVAPGVPVRIEVLEVVGPAGWIARIGCHTDNLRVSYSIALQTYNKENCSFSSI